MFFAAFMSLSWVTSQTHVHALSANVRVLFTSPHTEQSLLLGSNLPILTRFTPYQSDLYVSCRTNSLQATSPIALERLRFFDIPPILRFSSPISAAWLSRTILWLTLCR